MQTKGNAGNGGTKRFSNRFSTHSEFTEACIKKTRPTFCRQTETFIYRFVALALALFLFRCLGVS